MLVFIKTDKQTVSIDVDPEETVQSLKEKVSQRTEIAIIQFELIFAGRKLTEGKISKYNITKESTLHMKKLVSLKLVAEYKGVSRPLTIINAPGVTIRDLKREIRNVFPDAEEFGRVLPIVRRRDEVLENLRPLSHYSLKDGDNLTVIEDTSAVASAKTSVGSSSKSKDSGSTSCAAQITEETMDEDKKLTLLTSFASGATSSNVEIVFSFDTTGSMASCLAEVRKKLQETATRLMKDIPKIRIGIIAHGDYCDQTSSYVIKTIDLCDDVKKICEFVDHVSSTGGGDSPEAYELALRDAKSFSWTEDCSKALVIIGDEVPHPPSYTTEKINWFDELDDLIGMGVKVYGVRALNSLHAVPFYEELSERSGAVSIKFSSFNLIVDMFLAICYREASPDKLEQFAQEVKSEGKMNNELGQIFETLAQPNPEKKTEAQKILRSKEIWYDVDNDNGAPQFEYDHNYRKWKPYSSVNHPKTTTSTTTTPTRPTTTTTTRPTTTTTTTSPTTTTTTTSPTTTTTTTSTSTSTSSTPRGTSTAREATSPRGTFSRRATVSSSSSSHSEGWFGRLGSMFSNHKTPA